MRAKEERTMDPWWDWMKPEIRAAQMRRPRPIRATLRRRDGTCVRRVPLCSNDDFVFCLVTGKYYDRATGCTYVERFYPHHWQRVKEQRAFESRDPLDVNRADSGLPIFIAGGWM
jgi:hypothetical protein